MKHQQVVGAGYFDAVQQAITSGKASTTVLDGSTEAAVPSAGRGRSPGER
jgi:isocitrate lyase